MMPATALLYRHESNEQTAIAEKMDIAQLILAVLSPFPYGLTTREIVELSGLASYNASGKLSKMAACGKIEGFTITGDWRRRWRAPTIGARR
jgi:hypothetical protein